MAKLQLIVLIIVILVVLAGAFIFLNQPKDVQKVSEEKTAEKPSATKAEAKKFTLTESNFKLTPDTITVKQGDNVEITVVNSEGSHNLFIKGYEQRTKVISSGTEKLELVAANKGTFEMWCEVSGHKELGMVGNFVVE